MRSCVAAATQPPHTLSVSRHSDKRGRKMKGYKVRFNSVFTLDGFGYRGNGTVTIDKNGVEYRGEKTWGAGIEVSIWAVLWVASIFISNIRGISSMTIAGSMSWLTPIVLIILVQLVCKSKDTLHLAFNSMSNFSVEDNKIQFSATSSEGKKAKAFFKVTSESTAKEIAEQIEPNIKIN